MLDQKLSTSAMKGSCLREQPLECAGVTVAGVERHLHARGVCLLTSSIDGNVPSVLYIVLIYMQIYCYKECSFIIIIIA